MRPHYSHRRLCIIIVTIPPERVTTTTAVAARAQAAPPLLMKTMRKAKATLDPNFLGTCVQRSTVWVLIAVAVKAAVA